MRITPHAGRRRAGRSMVGRCGQGWMEASWPAQPAASSRRLRDLTIDTGAHVSLFIERAAHMHDAHRCLLPAQPQPLCHSSEKKRLAFHSQVGCYQCVCRLGTCFVTTGPRSMATKQCACMALGVFALIVGTPGDSDHGCEAQGTGLCYRALPYTPDSAVFSSSFYRCASHQHRLFVQVQVPAGIDSVALHASTVNMQQSQLSFTTGQLSNARLPAAI